MQIGIVSFEGFIEVSLPGQERPVMAKIISESGEGFNIIVPQTPAVAELQHQMINGNEVMLNFISIPATPDRS